MEKPKEMKASPAIDVEMNDFEIAKAMQEEQMGWIADVNPEVCPPADEPYGHGDMDYKEVYQPVQ
jgi:hypothetical protein